MLFLFRNNRFTTVFLLVVYAALLRIGALAAWIPPLEPTVAGTLYHTLFGSLVDKPQLSAFLSWLIVVFQGALINLLADRHRLSDNRTWLPGLSYVLLCSSMADFLFVSPPLVAATFLIAALVPLFNTYKMLEARLTIFDVGFWTGVAALFYPPALGMLIAALLALNTMRSFNIREHLALVAGAFTPIWLGWIVAFWFDHGWEFFDAQFYGFIGWVAFTHKPLMLEWLKLGFTFALIAIALVNSTSFLSKKLIHVQKRITVLYMYLLTIGLGVLFRNDPTLQYLLIAMPVLGLFTGIWLEGFSRRWIAEIVHLVLVAVAFLLQFPYFWLG